MCVLRSSCRRIHAMTQGAKRSGRTRGRWSGIECAWERIGSVNSAYVSSIWRHGMIFYNSILIYIYNIIQFVCLCVCFFWSERFDPDPFVVLLWYTCGGGWNLAWFQGRESRHVKTEVLFTPSVIWCLQPEHHGCCPKLCVSGHKWFHGN